MFPELTPVLRALEASPKDISEEHMAVIERFVILLYDRTSSLTSVHEARAVLKKVKKPRQHSFNHSGTCQPCQEGSVSRWNCLAADPSNGASITMSFSVGMAA